AAARSGDGIGVVRERLVMGVIKELIPLVKLFFGQWWTVVSPAAVLRVLPGDELNGQLLNKRIHRRIAVVIKVKEDNRQRNAVGIRVRGLEQRRGIVAYELGAARNDRIAAGDFASQER